MKSIEELYGAFGQDVVREVKACMDKHGSLAPMLARLNLPPSSTLNAQHESLRSFLYQYGIALFLRVMHSTMTPAEVETAKGELLLSRLVGDTRSRMPAKTPVAPGHHPTSSASATSSTGAPPVASPKPAEPTEPRIIVTPTYVGPERRSGKDRRRNKYDRRLQVELIYHNRRFGGRDRRKSIRREEDRKKP